MSQFAKVAAEGRWMEAAKYCFMLNNFQGEDAKKVDFIHRSNVYILAYVRTKKAQGKIHVTYAMPMAILSTKEAAEKQLEGYVKYMDENIGCYMRWDRDLDKYVPTYTEEKGDPKPIRLEAENEWGKYQVQTFSNYPQFKVGYVEIQIQ
jgi:hypothetical protein